MARTILGSYKTYPWKDHDPILDKLSRLYELAGVVKANGRVDIEKVSYLTGMSVGTLRRWENRDVKRPQHTGIKAVANALGATYDLTYKGKVVKGSYKDHAQVVRARAEAKRQRALAKRPKKVKARGNLQLVHSAA